MEPFTYLKLAELRGRELQRQAEHRSLIRVLASTQPKALEGVRERLAAFLARWRRGERSQPLGC